MLQQEIEAEQRHVDRVYARLAELRRDASRAEKEGYRLAGVGTFGALVERDAMVFHAARRRQALDTEHPAAPADVSGTAPRSGGLTVA